MAAPAAVSQPTLTSGAADPTYNENLAAIEHGESNLFGNSYGTTGEIGGSLGEQILNTNQGMERQVGPNFAKTGELGGSLGEGQARGTRALSARAGANTQSGLYGTARGSILQGFGRRAASVEETGKERIKSIENRAREKWEADQRDRGAQIRKANERYEQRVARNPMAPPGVTAAGGGPPGSSVTAGPGSPQKPLQFGFKEVEAREAREAAGRRARKGRR